MCSKFRDFRPVDIDLNEKESEYYTAKKHYRRRVAWLPTKIKGADVEHTKKEHRKRKQQCKQKIVGPPLTTQA